MMSMRVLFNLDELNYATVEKHAKQLATLYENVSEELDIFITFLNET